MRGNSSILLRRLHIRRPLSNIRSAGVTKTIILPPTKNPAVTKILPSSRNYMSATSTQPRKLPSLQFQRTLCSSPGGASNTVAIKSGEELSSSLGKVKDESLPAIFHFTAVWCGPCRLISPVIGELSSIYPHVKTFKIDIDQEELGNTLNELNISAVPTLLFFKNGERVAEIVGADVSLLKTTMEQLYKKE